MNWLTKIRARLGHDELPSFNPDATGTQDALSAFERASSALNEARQRREEVREVTSQMAVLRNRNHFGESIELAMMRKEKKQ